jgi:uncharacterized membrane protein
MYAVCHGVHPSMRSEPRVRVESVDSLRGLAIIIMPLDHVRDFFSSYSGNPTIRRPFPDG